MSDQGLLRPPSKVCEKCQLIFSNHFEHHKPETRHHESFAALKESARNGCGVCSQFLDGFPGDVLEVGGGRENYSSVVPYPSLPPLRVFVLRMPYAKGDWNLECGETDKGDGKFSMRSSIKMYPTSTQALFYDSPTPNTVDALPLCRKWLHECRSSHSLCGPPQSRELPTRLIAVDEGAPRVCLAKDGVRNESQYAALSHRWASLEFLTLKKANEEQFSCEIPPEALPKTFLDAIQVCRHLGIPYLWIDSLCILQDSKEDWEREAARMAEVYGNCDLNIAATAAEDGSVGCFFERGESWRCQWSSPRRDALKDRSWIVQERYLSRRTLHFTERQVFWECDEQKGCEFYPHGCPGEIFSSDYRFALLRRTLSYGRWLDLVRLYSQTHLTKDGDKLAAIEGLARTVQAEGRGRYVAGLWSNDIAKQLCWNRESASSLERIEGSTGPSWSWASFRGAIRPNSITRDPCVEVHDLKFRYATGSPFREVEDAVLRLACGSLLLPGRIEDASRPNVAVGHLASKIHLDLDQTEARDVVSAYFLPVVVNTDTPWGAGTRRAALLPTLRLRGLVLTPTLVGKGEYRRLGVFTAFEPLEKFAAAARAAGGREYRDLFVEVLVGEDGEETFLVDLV